MINKQNSNNSSGEGIKSLEKALMSDSDVESGKVSPVALQNVYDSYKSIIQSVEKDGKKNVGKSFEPKAIKSKEVAEVEEKNAKRRARYAQYAIEAGRKYKPREERKKYAKWQPRKREAKPGYYTNAKRHQRRVQKSIKAGLSKEDAIQEAIQHFQKLKDWQRGKLT